jgi:hypothetical protein
VKRSETRRAELLCRLGADLAAMQAPAIEKRQTATDVLQQASEAPSRIRSYAEIAVYRSVSISARSAR